MTYYPTLNFSRLWLQWNADGDDHVIMHVGWNWRARPWLRDVSDKVDSEYCVVLQRQTRRTIVNNARELHLQFWSKPVISSPQFRRTPTDSSDIQLADRAVECICANDERLKLVCWRHKLREGIFECRHPNRLGDGPLSHGVGVATGMKRGTEANLWKWTCWKCKIYCIKFEVIFQPLM